MSNWKNNFQNNSQYRIIGVKLKKSTIALLEKHKIDVSKYMQVLLEKSAQDFEARVKQSDTSVKNDQLITESDFDDQQVVSTGMESATTNI